MSRRSFRALLTQRQIVVSSRVCVGLDPVLEKLPEHIRASCASSWQAVYHWMADIVDATAPYASMFKPQHAYWESFDGGIRALRLLITHIHLKHPGIPVFMDCKRGDIDRTQEQYGVAHFLLEEADGMNYNGYMGSDTLKALAKFGQEGRALVGLGRTSNPSAWKIQDQQLVNGLRVWEQMARYILDWSRDFGVIESAGIVMGAAHKDPLSQDRVYSDHLVRGREIYSDELWNLIPGIGTQKGFVEQTVLAADRGPGSIAINNSSAIIFASNGRDFAEAAANKAKEMRDEINQYQRKG